jgi:hypothetical protein
LNRTRSARVAAASTAAAALAGLALTAAPAQAAPAPGASVTAQLASVRAATAKYHDVATAIADGYVPNEHCEASPAGTMGFHYINYGRLMGTDVTQPPILLYVPAADGGVRLAGVEYFHVDADQDVTTNDDVPSLFGQRFNGPMLGHEPGMPIHDDLHVWLWAHNPNGMFAQWNPSVSC